MFKWILFFLLFFCVGSAHAVPPVMGAKEIILGAMKVKTSDGVDKKEALLLAQKFLIDKEVIGYDVSRGKVLKLNQQDQMWRISFSSYEQKNSKKKLPTYEVWVPAKDGVITISFEKMPE